MGRKKSFGDLLKSSDVPVLVDFYADWCSPCKILSPTVREVSSAFHGRLKVIKVDVDKNQRAAMKYGIRSIPTLILFKKGRILWRQAGVLNKRQLQAVLEKNLP